jgi:ATP-binding cassette subfamily F protein 3
MLFTASGVSKSYGQNVILDNISFHINPSEKIGVVGKNGAGKTTLFNIISGSVAFDSGSVVKSAFIKTGELAQMPDLNLSLNAYDNLISVFDNVIQIEKEMAETEKEIASSALRNENCEKLLEKYSRLVEKHEHSEGYSYPSLIRGALKGFGFDDEKTSYPVSNLSGGEQNKIAFIKLLLSKPDLLLLDEPTNYFDIATIIWLENYLKNYSGAVMIISHDRYFLDALCGKIFEIEDARLNVFTGNYTEYLKLKAKVKEEEYKKFIQQKKEIMRQEQIIAQFRQYNKEKSVKQAESRQKKLDKLSRLENPGRERIFINLSFKCKNIPGKNILQINNLSKAFGSNQIIKDFSHTFYKNQKTGIFGPNGTGKSTLLNIISGIDDDYSGEIKFGHNVEAAYSEQFVNFKHNTVLDEILYMEDENLTLESARNYLAMFLFYAEDVCKNISVLSGGEKSRLNLLKTMIRGANLVLLDEPTNHLDSYSQEALEKALKNYDGTLIIVSHDRYFLNNICDNLLVFENGSIKHYDGNYDYYLSRKEKPCLEENVTNKQKNNNNIHKDNQKKNAKFHIKELESLIYDTENTIRKTEALICRPDFYKSETSKDILMDYEKLRKQLEKYENEWIELNEKNTLN